MPFAHTIKRTWSSPTGTPIAFSAAQVGNVEANLDLAIPGGTNLQSAISILRATLQSFFLVSSQPVSVYVGGANSRQTITKGGTIDPSDQFVLVWSGQTTTPLPFTATAAAMQAALEALSNIGVGNVQVTGPAGGPWVVEFVGSLALGARAAITAIVATIATAALTIVQSVTGTSPSQTMALAAGVAIDWSKDDLAANPLSGDVAKLSVYVPGAATAAVQLRSLFN
jgi:hypothetical protein